MKEPVTLCVLVVLCYSSFTRGNNDPGPSMAPLNFSQPETSSPPIHNSSATEPSSLGNSTPSHLNTSSELDSSTTAELSPNGTVSQVGNDTIDHAIKDSTEAPASTASTAGTAVDLIPPLNSTDAPGNLTDKPEGSDLSAGDNHTHSTPAGPNNTTLTTDQPPKVKPLTSTSTPTTVSQTPSATTTLSQSTTASQRSASTRPVATTAQIKQRSSTVTIKAASTSTTTTLQTTETSKPRSSTPVQAEARADTPSELNVGDDESGATMDPLLAGLVSVFVVTAAIVSLIVFLKFRRRNERPEFRRLQDLPMDDMMEDTPLSMYSY